MELESHTYSFRATLVGVHSFWHGRVNMFRCSEAVEKEKKRKQWSGPRDFSFLIIYLFIFILEKYVTRLRTESASEHSLLLVTAVTRHGHHWSFFFFGFP